MTLACWSRAAHSMPAMIQESWPLPVVVEDLADEQVGAGGDALLLAAGGGAGAGDGGGDVRAVAVVVDDVLAGHEAGRLRRSGRPGPGGRCRRRCPARRRPRRCRCCPLAHTCGAPICAVVSARSALTLPSSQTLAMPPVRAGLRRRYGRVPAAGPVSAVQKSAAPARSLGQRRALDAARGRGPCAARRAPPGCACGRRRRCR